LRGRHMRGLREHGPMSTPHQGQGRILALLRIKPEISQKELSTILDIRSQSLGELLAKLERQGFITRTPSTEDRRVMDIRLTEAGKAASDALEEIEDTDSFLSCLTQEEQATLADYLERMIGKLEAQAETDDPEPGRHFHGPFGPEHPFERFHGRGHHRRG
ncbi:MAG TPA: MarR family transcriptional regulator, partial [Spirochaetia bacterium]|nr:MarR family transcriptional regulator [Spirochaetia bacterium]